MEDSGNIIETGSESLILKNERTILQMFYSDEEYRVNIRSPFLQNGYVCASDGKMLIRIDESLYDTTLGYKETVDGLLPPDLEKVIPKVNFEEILTLGELEDAIRKYPVSDYDYRCPECGGTGCVDWTYESRDGSVHHLNDVCPECDGEGTLYKYSELYAQYMIHGVAFCYAHIDTLIKTMKLIGVELLVIRFVEEYTPRPVLLTTTDNKVQIMMSPQLVSDRLSKIIIKS